MKVPLLDLRPQNGAVEKELRAAFERVLASGAFILGPEVERFEQALADVTGARHALGVSSGTDALLLAFMALGIGPGDEVLCPTFTFFATAGCVARVGAKPIFVDSCSDSFNLDVNDLEKRITPRTKAIVPVHLFGQAADMDEILALAAKHKLRVIEDAAQAMGATYGNRQVGTMGDFGVVSFFPTKNLGALGDAGALLTNDDDLAAKARVLRLHGSEPKYYHRVIGGNFRIDALQAAFLAVKLPRFASYTSGRCRNAAHYAERLGSIADPTRLILPTVRPGRDSIWNQYTLRIPGKGRRDALRAHLAKNEVGSEIYYPLPLHEQECFASLGHRPEDFPIARQLAHEVISLPIYPELPVDALERVTDVLRDFFTIA